MEKADKGKKGRKVDMAEMKRLEPWADPSIPGDMPDEIDLFFADAIDLDDMTLSGLEVLLEIYIDNENAKELAELIKEEISKKKASNADNS